MGTGRLREQRYDSSPLLRARSAAKKQNEEQPVKLWQRLGKAVQHHRAAFKHAAWRAVSLPWLISKHGNSVEAFDTTPKPHFFSAKAEVGNPSTCNFGGVQITWFLRFAFLKHNRNFKVLQKTHPTLTLSRNGEILQVSRSLRFPVCWSEREQRSNLGIVVLGSSNALLL